MGYAFVLLGLLWGIVCSAHCNQEIIDSAFEDTWESEANLSAIRQHIYRRVLRNIEPIGRSEDAEEITQDVLFAIYKYRHYGPKSVPKMDRGAFLTTVIRNRCATWLRHSQKQSGDVRRNVPWRDDLPDHRKDDDVDTFDEINAFPHQFRNILRLRMLHRSYREISRELHLSLGYVFNAMQEMGEVYNQKWGKR